MIRRVEEVLALQVPVSLLVVRLHAAHRNRHIDGAGRRILGIELDRSRNRREAAGEVGQQMANLVGDGAVRAVDLPGFGAGESRERQGQRGESKECLLHVGFFSS